MKTLRKLIIYSILLGISPLLPAQGKSETNHSPSTVNPPSKVITLEATQATGGQLIKTDQGKDAVLFAAANLVNDKISWTIPGTLAAGLWQLDIDFYQPEGSFSPNQFLTFEGENNAKPVVMDLFNIGFTKGTYTKSIGYYNYKATSVLSFVKTKQRNNNTVAIRSIRIVPVAPSVNFEKFMFVYQLPVTGKQVTLPATLPTGVYLLSAPLPVSVNWQINNGKKYTTPLGTEHRVYIDQPTQPSINTGEQIADVQLVHYVTPTPPDMSSAGNLPLIPAIDSTKTETRTLKLIGYTGKKMPALDLLPGGKSMAIVTSWDDGRLMDFTVLEMLLKYDMKGTFFVNRNSAVISRLSELEAKGMEIGSHSWSHPIFNVSTPQRCMDEAVEMCRFLEKELAHPIISFAYPYNYLPAYDANGDYVLRSLRQAGYWSGRVTTNGNNRIDSLQGALAMRPNFHFSVGATKTKEKFENLLRHPGSILYIWGHSYELANGGDKTLDEVLAAVAHRPEVWYAHLGELMIWQYTRNNLKILPAASSKSGNSFTLKMPWIHPFLRQVPVSLTVPEGVTEVLWQDKKVSVVNGRVELVW